MKSYLTHFMVLLLSLSASVALANRQTLTADTTQGVALSNRDINRVVCAEGAISDVFYSEEKGMLVEVKGQNAFVKFLIRKQAGLNQYVNQTAELHIVCAGEVYTLVANPQPIVTQTVYLSGGLKTRIKDNLRLFRAMAKEEQLLQLTQAVYRDEIPETYQVQRFSSTITVSPKAPDMIALYASIQLTKLKEVRVEGLGYRATEYAILAKAPVALLESDFAQPSFGSTIAAITVTPLQLNSGQIGRLIIIDEGIQP